MFLNLLGFWVLGIQTWISIFCGCFMETPNSIASTQYVLYIILCLFCFASCLTIGFRFYWQFMLNDKFYWRKIISTGIERSLQVVWESSCAEHSLWIVAIANISSSVNPSVEACSGSFASCDALCCCFANESSEGSSEPWRCWDEIVIHFALDSFVRCWGMCWWWWHQEGNDESIWLPLLNSNDFGEFTIYIKRSPVLTVNCSSSYTFSLPSLIIWKNPIFKISDWKME